MSDIEAFRVTPARGCHVTTWKTSLGETKEVEGNLCSRKPHSIKCMGSEGGQVGGSRLKE